MNKKEKLWARSKELPRSAGCYLMKNGQDEVIYVGKAKDLSSRVQSYFNESAKGLKTQILVSHIHKFDFIVTANDIEAFVLENNLIKKYTPKYNIRLKDDKSYPYIVVDNEKKFPKLEYRMRFKRKKKTQVFGPFVHGSSISEVLRILIKSFKLRDCSDYEFKNRLHPCLLYQLHQCSAPCVGKITEDNYKLDVNQALELFGKHPEKVLKELEKKMHDAAENENFEYAGMIRDHLKVLEDFLEGGHRQSVDFSGAQNIDLIAYYEGEIEVDLAIYMVRTGVLLGHKNFHFPRVDLEEKVDDELIQFLFQYYTKTHDTLPDSLICNLQKSHRDILSQGFNHENFKINVKLPRGQHKELYELTQKQAYEHQRFRQAQNEAPYVGLNKLKELLDLKEKPVVLECYDVAVFQGSSPAASQIVYHEGYPDKKNYRYYHLQTRPEGNNDFYMMREFLERRLKHGNLPDVMIVDGGVGQVSALQEVLKEKNTKIPVVGLAKAKTKSEFDNSEISKSDERLIIPGRKNPYILSKNRSLFKILVSMRDEAHRFSRKLHHKSEKKRTFHSWLDEIQGIGAQTKKKILSQMDIPKRDLERRSAREISELLNINQKVAQKIKKYLESTVT